MAIPQPSLRPLNAGEILDRAFRLYRANFLLLLGIACILLVPTGILQVLSQIYFQSTVLVVEAQAFLYSLLWGAMTWAASRAYLGLPVSINQAYAEGRHRFWSVWGSYFLVGLAFIPVGLLIALGGVAGDAGVVCGVALAVPYVSFLYTRWAVSTPAILIENLGASDSLSRSWSLTSKDAWHVFATSSGCVLLVYLMASLPGIAVKYAMSQYGFLPIIGPVLAIIITQLGALISTPLSLGATVILYYDLRVRREAYDLELALQALDGHPTV